MRVFVSLLVIASIFFSVFSSYQSYASIFDDGNPELEYCKNNDCGLDNGITQLKDNLDDVVTDQKASDYIQNIVKYLLTFLTLIGVIYIIYAWFNILTWAGDEEKAKKSKTIIIFVIIGILIIYLAGPILEFILNILTPSETTS